MTITNPASPAPTNTTRNGLIAGGMLLAMVVALAVLFAWLGQDTSGSHPQLYAVLHAHGSTMTDDQADAMVEKIAATAHVSKHDAERMAIQMAGGPVQ